MKVAYKDSGRWMKVRWDNDTQLEDGILIEKRESGNLRMFFPTRMKPQNRLQSVEQSQIKAIGESVSYTWPKNIWSDYGS